MASIMITNEPVQKANYVPWMSSAAVYNMKYPERMIDITACEGDMAAWLLEQLKPLDEVETIYIDCDLDREAYAFLASMPNLSSLYLYTAKELQSLEMIRGLLKLREICIISSAVADIAPLAELMKAQAQKRETLDENDWWGRRDYELQNICIMDAKISSLEPFAGVKAWVEEFNLCYNRVPDLAPLADIRIYYLAMQNNAITDIEPYVRAHDSYLVNVAHNQITDISFMADGCCTTAKLYVGENPIEDYSPLLQYRFRDCDVINPW